MTINNDIKRVFEKQIKLLEKQEKQAWEKSSEWGSYVIEPCKKYNFAPKEARAVLEICGLLSSYGINIRQAIKDVYKQCVTFEAFLS